MRVFILINDPCKNPTQINIINDETFSVFYSRAKQYKVTQIAIIMISLQ